LKEVKGNVTAISEKHLEIITQVAARTALEHLEKQKMEQEKKKYDHRLRNIKLLLRNYRSFKKHCEDVQLDVVELRRKLDIDELDTDEFKIRSIMRSKERTLAMVNYIDQTLRVYKAMTDASNDEQEIIRYTIVNDLFISENKKTIKGVTECQNIIERTVYREVDRACKTLAVLMFGIDGIRFND